MTTEIQANHLTDLESAVCLEMADSWAQDAAVMAKAVRPTLEMLGLDPALPWTNAFLYEVAAFSRIQYWHDSGLAAHIQTPLPSWKEMMLALQAEIDPAVPSPAKKLSDIFFSVFTTELNWRAVSRLGADVVMKHQQTCETSERVLDGLADFLYRHRHLMEGEPS